ncbi:MAG TPA: electron transfer flavoprotein subunit alpha/FixB family protein [Planctomycetes bacterium]|nr:electron transfer flavoprotein subunit alpha/FixB family protein [Planctomycetota bacterium]
MSTILVYVEHKDGAPKRASLEALGAARSVSDNVVAVLFGEGAREAAAGAAGAAKAVVLSGDTLSPDAIAKAVAEVAGENGASAFFASATSSGRDLAPRIAALLDSTLLSDCVAVTVEGDGIVLQRPWLAGKLLANLKSNAQVVCATLRRNVFAASDQAGPGEIVDGPALGEGLAKRTALDAKEGGPMDVSEAPVVVAGGRGMGSAEGFGILEELAAAFGNAAVGASRAVVDAGWRPHSEQVGQTGKTVSPQLYIAAGISGAIQHLAGMKTSKVIVAINKDAEAPIFKVADYGIVGDAFEVVPALTEEVKRIRAL